MFLGNRAASLARRNDYAPDRALYCHTAELQYPTMDVEALVAATPFRILALDGGGAKGFYTLGVLEEVEALAGSSLSARFDLIFGTSTGAIIAALLALGKS